MKPKMATIQKLPKKNARAHAEIVETLQEYLKRAESGEIEAIAIATVFTDENGDKAVRRTWNVGYDGYGFTLYAGIGLMHKSMAEWMIGDSEEIE